MIRLYEFTELDCIFAIARSKLSIYDIAVITEVYENVSEELDALCNIEVGQSSIFDGVSFKRVQ